MYCTCLLSVHSQPFDPSGSHCNNELCMCCESLCLIWLMFCRCTSLSLPSKRQQRDPLVTVALLTCPVRSLRLMCTVRRSLVLVHLDRNLGCKQIRISLLTSCTLSPISSCSAVMFRYPFFLFSLSLSRPS